MTNRRNPRAAKGGRRPGGSGRVTAPGASTSRPAAGAGVSGRFGALSVAAPAPAGGRRAPGGKAVTVFLELARGERRSDDVELLTRTVESLQAQTLAAFEVVVHDSGYDDERSAVVTSWARADKRITVVPAEPVAGLAEGMAVLARVGTAPNLLWLRDGDVLSPRALEHGVAGLDSASSAVAATGRRDLLSATGRMVPGRPSETALVDESSVLVGAEVAASMVTRHLNYLGGPSAVLLRRTVVRAVAESAALPRQWTAAVVEARFLPLWIEVLSRGDLAYGPSSVCRERVDDYWTGDLPRHHVDAALSWVEAVFRALSTGVVPDGPLRRSALLGVIAACVNLLRRHPEVPQSSQLLPVLGQLVDRIEELASGATAVEEPAAVAGPGAVPEVGLPVATYDASVVIPFCNDVEGLVRCLNAVAGTSSARGFEVVLVDDASTEEGVDDLLATLDGDLQVIRHRTYEGPAACWNEALAAARSDIVVLLDPEAEVAPGWLDALLAGLEDEPGTAVALAGLPLVAGDSSPIAAGLDLVPVRRPDGVVSLYPRPRVAGEVTGPVDGLVAGCVAVRRPALVEVGPFDESRFDGEPMLELCLRARAAGWAVRAAAGPAVTLHEEARRSPSFRESRWRADAVRGTWDEWVGLAPADGRPPSPDLAEAPPEPLVTIMIPTYQRGDLLERAIETARAQTVADVEILLWDNGSSDETLDVLTRAAKADERIAWGRSPRNLGPLGNGDRLLGWTSGTYGKFLADDDLLDPTFLEALLDAMVRSPSVRLAYTKRRYVDKHGALLPDGLQPEQVAKTDCLFDGARFGTMMLQHCDDLVGGLSTSLWRRRDLEGLGGFGRIGDRAAACQSDGATWLALMAGGQVAYQADTLCLMTHHPDQGQRAADQQIAGCHEWFLLLQAGPSLGYLTRPGERADAYLQFASSVAAIELMVAQGEREGEPGKATAHLWAHVREFLAELPTLRQAALETVDARVAAGLAR